MNLVVDAVEKPIFQLFSRNFPLRMAGESAVVPVTSFLNRSSNLERSSSLSNR